MKKVKDIKQIRRGSYLLFIYEKGELDYYKSYCIVNRVRNNEEIWSKCWLDFKKNEFFKSSKIDEFLQFGGRKVYKLSKKEFMKICGKILVVEGL